MKQATKRFSRGLLVAAMVARPALAARPLVAPLRDQDAVEGCSWSITAPSLGKGYVLLAEIDEARIFMNIDGKDTVFRLVSERGRPGKVGSRVEKVYRADAEGVTVQAHYRVAAVCAKGDEDCEATQYTVTYEVAKGTRRQVVAGRGAAGC